MQHHLFTLETFGSNQFREKQYMFHMFLFYNIHCQTPKRFLSVCKIEDCANDYPGAS